MNRLQGQMDLIDFINSKPRHEPIEPNINHLIKWRIHFEGDRGLMYNLSLNWLFANEYYRMKLDKGDL